MTAVEPRFARIAASIADPTRARMLAILLSGEFRSAGELARASGVTPQAASTQLAQLLSAGLIVARVQGRHKYFALADADVAHALEALSLLAERDTVRNRWQSPRYAALKCARTCYGHLAGELGVALYRTLLGQQILLADDAGDLQLTSTGARWLAQIGLDDPDVGAHVATQARATAKTRASARFAYPCMDWSERHDHLAGNFARILLQHFLAKRWIATVADSRALKLTPLGQREFAPLLK